MTTYEAITRKVEALAKELPGITFGYIGNCGLDRSGQFDDRHWHVLLPHPGRVGSYYDSVSLGPTSKLAAALAGWDTIAVRARRLYHNGDLRVIPSVVVKHDRPLPHGEWETLTVRDGDMELIIDGYKLSHRGQYA